MVCSNYPWSYHGEWTPQVIAKCKPDRKQVKLGSGNKTFCSLSVSTLIDAKPACETELFSFHCES